jgi:hypothetical protein
MRADADGAILPAGIATEDSKMKSLLLATVVALAASVAAHADNQPASQTAPDQEAPSTQSTSAPAAMMANCPMMKEQNGKQRGTGSGSTGGEDGMMQGDQGSRGMMQNGQQQKMQCPMMQNGQTKPEDEHKPSDDAKGH